MRHVLDTSAVIQLVEQRHAGVVASLRQATEPPLISVVTLAELAIGWSTHADDSLRRRTYRAAHRISTVDITADPFQAEPSPLVKAFGVCRRAGIKGNDAWIAATAHSTGAHLLTFDAILAERYTTVGDCTLFTV